MANTLNDEPLSTEGSHPLWPLRFVGSEVFSGNKVGNIVEIALVELITPPLASGRYNFNLTGK
jgi:hypothetical protein